MRFARILQKTHVAHYSFVIHHQYEHSRAKAPRYIHNWRTLCGALHNLLIKGRDYPRGVRSDRSKFWSSLCVHYRRFEINRLEWLFSVRYFTLYAGTKRHFHVSFSKQFSSLMFHHSAGCSICLESDKRSSSKRYRRYSIIYILISFFFVCIMYYDLFIYIYIIYVIFLENFLR